MPDSVINLGKNLDYLRKGSYIVEFKVENNNITSTTKTKEVNLKKRSSIGIFNNFLFLPLKNASIFNTWFGYQLGANIKLSNGVEIILTPGFNIGKKSKGQFFYEGSLVWSPIKRLDESIGILFFNDPLSGTANWAAIFKFNWTIDKIMYNPIKLGPSIMYAFNKYGQMNTNWSFGLNYSGTIHWNK